VITYCADGIPIAIRLLNVKEFEPGPFNLGRAGPVIATIACLWVGFITVRMFVTCVNISSVCETSFLSQDALHSCNMRSAEYVQTFGTNDSIYSFQT
jgi:hypothetical protein